MFIIVRVREWMDFVRGILRQDHSNNICDVCIATVWNKGENGNERKMPKNVRTG